MSSERTLASTFIAAFRLSSAEFAGEMQVLFQEAPATWLALTVFSCKSRALFCFCLTTVATAHELLGAENRKRLPFAVAGYLRYKCGSVGIERTHNVVAHFRNYRANFIFKRRDFIGGSILEVDCD
jgi:hypothetical protein